MKLHLQALSRIIPGRFSIQSKFAELSKTIPKDTFITSSPILTKSNKNFFYELMGTFSKEDINLIDLLKNEYKKAQINIKEENIKILKELQGIKQRITTPATDKKNLIIDGLLLTQELKNTVKNNFIKLYALTILATESNPTKKSLPIDSTQNPIIKYSRFTHPRDKAESIIGALTKEDHNTIEKEEKQYEKLNDKDILNKKLKTLQKLQKTLNDKKSDFIGNFSAEELGKIKKLVINYEALNNIQKKNGSSTYQIEKKLFSFNIPKHIKKGDYLPGFGTIVNKIALDGVPAITVETNESGFSCLKMYDLEKLRKADSEEAEAKAVMSEIHSRKKEDFVLIQSFQNHNPKKYPNAGKVIGLQLIKILAEMDCKPIKIEALAYAGNKRSPVNYYMHFGFTPVSYTKEEIAKITKENNGRFPHEIPVGLIMPDFEHVRNRIKAMEKVYLAELPERGANISAIIDSVKSYIRNLFVNLFSC